MIGARGPVGGVVGRDLAAHADCLQRGDRTGRRARADGAAARGRADAAGRRRARRRAAPDCSGRVYGARVVLLVGSGDNGGDALYAGARLARRGAGVTRCPARPRPGAPPAGCAALRGRPAGAVADDAGRLAACRADLVVDGHRRHRRAAAAAPGGRGRAGAVPARASRARGRRRGPAQRRRRRHRRGARRGVRADATVTFGAYKPGLLDRPGAPSTPVRCGWSTSGSTRTCRPPELEALQHADVAALLPRPARGERQVPAGRGRCRRRVGALPGRRGARRRRARCAAARAPCGTWARPRTR